MASLVDFCLEQGFEKTYWIAYSGGLDSQVLLHLFAKLRTQYPLKLKVIHIHHGLSPNADQWAKRSADICAKLQIDFVLRKISVQALSGESQEAIARKLRYAAFAELLTVNDLLVTAHHQNDQAETVLLQLLRGSGPKGLAAMPRLKKLGAGWHARPLLDVTREELQQLAILAQLAWIEDESNSNTHFSRNFLRHHIVPLLQQRWPTVTKTLARVAENCADAQQVLEDIIRNDLLAAKGSQPNTLSVSYLKKLPPARQRLVLREWMHHFHVSAPPAKKMRQILIDMLPARADKSPHIHWGHVELRRYQDDIYFFSSVKSQVGEEMDISWDLQRPLVIAGIGTLHATLTRGAGIRLNINQVTVKFRQGGEQCHLPGRAIRHSLKKLFQEWKIPPWERDRVPLIYLQDELAAVVGFTVCNGFGVEADKEGYLIHLDVGATGGRP